MERLLYTHFLNLLPWPEVVKIWGNFWFFNSYCGFPMFMSLCLQGMHPQLYGTHWEHKKNLLLFVISAVCNTVWGTRCNSTFVEPLRLFLLPTLSSSSTVSSSLFSHLNHYTSERFFLKQFLNCQCTIGPRKHFVTTLASSNLPTRVFFDFSSTVRGNEL